MIAFEHYGKIGGMCIPKDKAAVASKSPKQAELWDPNGKTKIQNKFYTTKGGEQNVDAAEILEEN